MKKEEIDSIANAFHMNYNLVSTDYGGKVVRALGAAAIATIVDLLRGDVEGVQSPLSNLAINPNPDTAVSQPVDEDPNPITTETLYRLGALGMQSLSELKGYKVDGSKRILLFINGRYADSGWEAPDPHLDELMAIMRGSGVSFSVLS